MHMPSAPRNHPKPCFNAKAQDCKGAERNLPSPRPQQRYQFVPHPFPLPEGEGMLRRSTAPVVRRSYLAAR